MNSNYGELTCCWGGCHKWNCCWLKCWRSSVVVQLWFPWPQWEGVWIGSGGCYLFRCWCLFIQDGVYFCFPHRHPQATHFEWDCVATWEETKDSCVCGLWKQAPNTPSVREHKQWRDWAIVWRLGEYATPLASVVNTTIKQQFHFFEN